MHYALPGPRPPGDAIGDDVVDEVQERGVGKATLEVPSVCLRGSVRTK